jgi:hypothetical protein
MKKIIVCISILFVMTGLSGCKSGPQEMAAPPTAPEKNKSIFIEMGYDPALLITYDEKTGVIEDLQSRLHAMGFGVATSEDRADIILKITVNELELATRNKRLTARTTFGLVNNEAYMTYTASFIDNRTFDEIASTNDRVETTKFFPSSEEIKARFFTKMEDGIVSFMSESTLF